VELMVASGISAIVFAGILSAYLFVGRNLTRLVNTQHQEVESRRTLGRITQDVSAAVQLTTATATNLALTKQVSGTTTPVSYSYSSGNGTVTRTDSSGTQTLLNGVTAFAINYYDASGNAVTSGPQSVKSVEVSYTTGAGTSAAGTRALYSTVSPRVLLRNKPALK